MEGSLKILIVGGAGYIGQRLTPALLKQGHDVTIVDPGIHGYGDIDPAAVRLLKSPIERLKVADGFDCCIYLAGFHDRPTLMVSDALEWQQAARRLMIDEPSRIAMDVPHVIYFSSMRAMTHRNTWYGQMKHRAEVNFLENFTNVTLVRPGTVFGGLDPDKHNRTLTVPNKFLVTGELPDEEWSAYLTDMDLLVSLVTHIVHWAPGGVHQPLWGHCLYNRATLRDLVFEANGNTDVEIETVHPVIKMAKLYGLTV